MASREIEKLRRQKSRKLNRPKPKRESLPTILIVCEGENTEPSYFNQLKFKSATIISIGEGYNTVSLVKRAEQLAQEGSYEKVCCVFDKDDFNDYEFNTAIKLAENKGFIAAYSNQAFEYWLLLHFNDHQGGPMHRNSYNESINNSIKPLGADYDGNGCKIISPKFFNLLMSNDLFFGKPRYQLAIQRAKRIDKRLTHHSRAKEESSTTMHILLEYLLSFL